MQEIIKHNAFLLKIKSIYEMYGNSNQFFTRTLFV